MNKKGEKSGGSSEVIFRWIWVIALVVLPILTAVNFRTIQVNVWGAVLVLVYVTNVLFAGLTLRSLRQARISSDLLKASAAEAEEKRAKEMALIGSLGEGIVVTDKNGNVELINNQAEQMIGWSMKEVVGKKWYDVAPLQDESGKLIPAENRATQKVFETGKPVYSSVNYYVRRDGSRFSVGTTAAPVVVDGKTVGVIAVFRDITKEKEIDRAKTEFVSLASHQLRTPLSAIKWYSEMLANGDAGPLNPEQKEFVDYLYQSNERMIELVNSLLNISRLEMGRIKIEPVPTDLRELVHQVLTDLEPKVKEKKQKVEMNINQDIPKINVDPKLIRQVYLNLLSNAIKYTPENGTVTVTMEVKDDQVVSQITDTGYGIPKEDQKRLFERFFRASNAQKVQVEGTGLGLYLVKSIAEMSQGKIWFESTENKGTTFWFGLPLTGTPAKSGEVSVEA